MLRIKISIYTAILISVFTFASCNKETDIYKVSGKLENVEGDSFYISYEIGDSVIIDTIAINKKGEFLFEGKIDTLTVMSFHFNENTKSTFVFVDKRWNVKVKGDVKYPDLIEVIGGTVNDDLTAFKNKNKDLLESRTNIVNTAEERTNSNDSTTMQNYLSDFKSINFDLSNVATEYVKAHPEKIASVMLLNLFFKNESSISRLDENLKMLKGKAVDFPLTHELQNFRDKVKMSAVGSRAPSFSLKNLQGVTIRLQDFRGKYVLLSFVATTCNVCLEEKSDAIAAYNEVNKKDIEFITIVKDQEIIPISENMTDSVKWNILPVEGGWAAKQFDDYYIREIPYNILISPAGNILQRDLDILHLPEKMKELTKKDNKK